MLLNRIERRKLEFRDRITQAALRLFEVQGVADTSVASIIKEADIAHKTFFNHFPSRDHLLQHIVCTFSDHAYDNFRQTFKQYSNPKKKIEYCLTEIAKTLEPLDSHYKELINFYLISGTGNFRTNQKEKFVVIVKQIINDAKSQNILRPGFSVETLTDIVVGICLSILLNWSIEEDFPLIEKMHKSIAFINASVFVENEHTSC